MTRIAVVLAGGRSERMGRPKAGLVLDGATLLQRTVDACLAHDSARVVVSAPDSEVGQWLSPDDRVAVCLEDPPDGGPVAGIAAALAVAHPGPDDEVLLLACDLPGAPEVVAALVTGPLDVDAVVPVDAEDWPQWLAARYRAGALAAALAAQPSLRDVSVKRVMSTLERREVPLPEALLTDVDTPEQAARAQIAIDHATPAGGAAADVRA